MRKEDSIASSIVAKPKPATIDVLFIDMSSPGITPFWFFNSISGERLQLIGTTKKGQNNSIYLPKQVIFYGIESVKEFMLEEDIAKEMLSKGYIHVPNTSGITFMRYFCPKPPPAIGGSAAFITAGFPV
jgi:hypothetical protein